ncbi:hypothetical protein ABT116_46845, partial [Streptomyces sp. NPDC002130]
MRLVIARCRVDYVGRLTSHLPTARSAAHARSRCPRASPPPPATPAPPAPSTPS